MHLSGSSGPITAEVGTQVTSKRALPGVITFEAAMHVYKSSPLDADNDKVVYLTFDDMYDDNADVNWLKLNESGSMECSTLS